MNTWTYSNSPMPTTPLNVEKIRRVLSVLPELTKRISEGEVKAGQGVSGLSHAELTEVIADYYRLAEIASYVRRGGVKAMIYRLQTGRTRMAEEDYLDNATKKVAELAAAKQIAPITGNIKRNLIDRLQGVQPEEEEAVRQCLPELDEFLLGGVRKQVFEMELDGDPA